MSRYKWIRVHYETWALLEQIAREQQCTMEEAILKLAELRAKQQAVTEQQMKELRRRLWYVFKLILSYAQWRYCIQNGQDPGWLSRYLWERIHEIKKRFNTDVSALEKAIQLIEEAAREKRLSNKVIGEANDLIHDWCFRFLAQVLSP